MKRLTDPAADEQYWASLTEEILSLDQQLSLGDHHALGMN